MKPDDTDVKTAVNRGLAWVGAASSLVWLLDIVAMVVVLALWISQEQMGIAAVAITLFPVLDLASEMGMSWAVIQRDDHTEERLSTVFWINIGASGVLAALLAFVIGPILAYIHGHEIVAWLLTAYGAKLLVQNVYIIPNAMLKRELRFKELSVVRTLANVADFAGKIGFAAGGFGIWCFFLGPACRFLVQAIGYQVCYPWRPRFVFQFRETWTWVLFGLKASGSQLVYHVYTNVDYQVVGYVFGARANGLYWFAYELVLKPCFVIAYTLQNVAFPAYSRLKDQARKLIDQFISFTRLSLVVILGFLSIVVVSADDVLYLVWGEQGRLAAPAARILSGVGVLRALSFVIPPLLASVGRPGLSLVYNLIAAAILPAMFFVCAYTLGDRVGYISVAYAWVIGYPIAFAVLLFMALTLIDVSGWEYLRRVMGVPLCAAAAVGVGFGVRFAGDALAPGPRLVTAAAAIAITFVLLLGAFQGMSPRAIARAMKSSGGN